MVRMAKVYSGIKNNWLVLEQIGKGDAGEVFLVESKDKTLQGILKRPLQIATGGTIIRQASQIETEGEILFALAYIIFEKPLFCFNPIIFLRFSFSRIIFCYILLWKWEYLAEKSRYAVVIIKIYILSSLSFIVFSDIPTLAFRVSELLGIVEIVLIPYILYLIKNRTIGKLILSFIALGFLCLTLLYERIIAF